MARRASSRPWRSSPELGFGVGVQPRSGDALQRGVSAAATLGMKKERFSTATRLLFGFFEGEQHHRAAVIS
jgi:hypothetical protein